VRTLRTLRTASTGLLSRRFPGIRSWPTLLT